MKTDVNLDKVLEITRTLVKDNLKNSDEYSDEQKKAIVEYVGPVLWFTLQHQGLELIAFQGKNNFKALVQSLRNVL